MSKIVLKRGLNFVLIIACLSALILLYYFLADNLLIKETFATSQKEMPNEEQLIDDTEERTAWQYEFSDAGSALIYPTLVVSDKFVYAGINQTMYAIDKQNGHQVWEYKVADMIIGQPVIVGDIVYFAAGNKLYAVDGNGELKWHYQTNTNIEPSLMVSDGILYFGSADNKLQAVSQSGQLIWSIDIGGKVSVPPVAVEGKLYFGCSSQHFYAVAANNGQIIWKVSMRGEVQSTPVVYNDAVFFTSVVVPTEYNNQECYLYAVNRQNGNLKWKNNTKELLTDLAYYNGLVYVGDTNGKLYTYEYRWGQKKWEFQKEDQQMLSSLIVDTTAFFQNDNNYLFAVDIVSGKLMWEVITDGVIKTSPVIDKDHTYFYSNGYICALKNNV